MANKPSKHHEPLLHIVKRDALPGWKAWLIRLAAILMGLLLSGIVASLLIGKPLGTIYSDMFEGAFGRILEGNTFILCIPDPFKLVMAPRYIPQIQKAFQTLFSEEFEILYYNALCDKVLAGASDHYPVYADLKLTKQ